MSWQWVEDGQGDKNAQPDGQQTQAMMNARAAGNMATTPAQAQAYGQQQQAAQGGLGLWDRQQVAGQAANVASMEASRLQSFGTGGQAAQVAANAPLAAQPAQPSQAGQALGAAKQSPGQPIQHTFDKWSMFGGRGGRQQMQANGMNTAVPSGAAQNLQSRHASQLAANAPKPYDPNEQNRLYGQG